MSDILPTNSRLDDVMELENADTTFTYTLTEEGAKFVSINITEYTPNTGIIVKGNRFYGAYKGVFSFGNDSLMYRKGAEPERHSAPDWESLPPPKEADLFLWRAPTNLRKTFTYTVQLKYTVTSTPSEPGESPVTSEKVVNKTYSQDVVGNWSIWGEKLRAYVNAGK
ncbi:hypothetical protein [Cronobacter phage vB_Cdu_VP8]|nr:hypothetical protein [Cronobacter phage vB_Cdu_VP8]